MSWDLDGRVALITGGASGIGAELARQLARKGMRIGLIDRDGTHLDEIVPGAETAVADVRDAEGLTAAIDDLARRLGGIDVAVANAGIATGGPLRMVAPETVEETIDVNLLGVWRTTRAALPHVLERRGHLLLIASAAAVLPAPGLGAYSASKAGVEALGRALRVELRPHGVSVGVGYYLFLATPDGRGRRPLADLRAHQGADAEPAGEDLAARARDRAHGARDRGPPPGDRAPAVPARADAAARPARLAADRPGDGRRDPADGGELRRRGRARRRRRRGTLARAP